MPKTTKPKFSVLLANWWSQFRVGFLVQKKLSWRLTALLVVSLIITGGGIGLIRLINTNQTSALAPTVSSVSPNHGVLAGGNTVTITGDNFVEYTSVHIETISGGDNHTCATASDGRAYCWGRNQYGQLGTGDTNQTAVPVAVDTSGVLNGLTVKQISTGIYHTCAIASDDQAYCWGYNTNGQLGSNIGTQSTVPVAVDTSGVLNGLTVKQISAGGYHTCVVASDDQAYCWGRNVIGQLGNGYTSTTHEPTKVDTSGELHNKIVSQISAGMEHTCAVTSDGGAYCWGGNGYGQLGNNDQPNRSLLPAVVDTSGELNNKAVWQIAAGRYFTCAAATDNVTLESQAYCWGRNEYGQLGNDGLDDSPIPVAVDTNGVLNGLTIKQIVATSSNIYSSSACAIASDDKAYCWGRNDRGRLGDGTANNSSIPVAVDTSRVLADKDIKQISAGGTHTCAVTIDDWAYCWGYNAFSQLGNGTASTSYFPMEVAPGEASQNIQVKFGDNPSTNIDWRSSTELAVVVPTGANPGTVDITVTNPDGDTTTLNQSYTYSAPLTATTVSPIRGVLTGGNTATITGTGFSGQAEILTHTIAGGISHSCAIASDGQAYCWGKNNIGQLGNNSTEDSLTPVAVWTGGVLAGKTIKQIAASNNHTCVIASDNQAYCWGYNSNSQLGNGNATDSSIPVAVKTDGVLSGKTIKQISAGFAHTCAVTSDEQAYCWGYNAFGQLGNGSTNVSSVPVAIARSGTLADKAIKSVTAGGYSSCVITSDSQAYCWGRNVGGLLGNGTTFTAYLPTAVDTSGVLNGKSVQQIGLSTNHTCAIADSQAYCWGTGSGGRLGRGNNTGSSVPVAVWTDGVLNGKTLQQIGVGDGHTSVLASDDQVYCWGINTSSQLGNNSTINQSNVPVAVWTDGVLNGLAVKQIGVGNNHTCTVASDHHAYCWGRNSGGQLGNGELENSAVPVDTLPGAVPAGGVATGDLVVAFGNQVTNNTTWNSYNELEVVVPAGVTAGPTDIVVINPSGEAATLANGYTYYTTPSAPQNLTATPDFTGGSTGRIFLDWDDVIPNSSAPGGDGYDGISDYKIEYCPSNELGVCSDVWIEVTHSPSTNSSILVTNLDATGDAYYTFRVSAINSVGTGEASSIVTELASYLSLTADIDQVDLLVDPLPDGRMSSSRQEIRINTNNSSGYDLKLSMIDSTQNLQLGANAIIPVNGTLTSPLSGLSIGTWGYRVDGIGGFGMGHHGIDPTQVETNISDSAYSWAAVPAVTTPDTISSLSTAPTSQITTNVFYGMKVDPTKPAGDYTNKVVYTLVARP